MASDDECVAPSLPVVTVAEMMDHVMRQCSDRGLDDCATWLGELALDATQDALRTTIHSRQGRLTAALIARQDAVLLPECCTTTAAEQDDGHGGVWSVAERQRLRWYHRVALGLLAKGEHQRCHHLITNALREFDGPSSSSSSSPSTSGCAPASSSTDGAATMDSGEIHVGGGVGHAWSTPPWLLATFATSRLPSALQFMCLYALYMDGQKVKNTSAHPHRSTNPHLRLLRTLLNEALRNPHNQHTLDGQIPSVELPQHHGDGGEVALGQDAYLSWLLGVVLRGLRMHQESATMLLSSVLANPLLWCAWLDLSHLVSREAQLEEISDLVADVEPAFMVDVFVAMGKTTLGVAPATHCCASTTATGVDAVPEVPVMLDADENEDEKKNEVRRTVPDAATTPAGGEVVDTWAYLLRSFPNNAFLQTQFARLLYHQWSEHDKAERIYARIYCRDPYRLESLPDYSNLLFMRGERQMLCALAQRAYSIDSFRAESNFVVGNYYVLLGQHDRSVLHFRRATAIAPHFVPAWTLLGHAYVETKNTQAAVEAFRTAVELDERDYRGWYNLGQIYELLQAYHHALYYYWRTTSLRPTDPRMWTAVANCLLHEGRRRESIVCLERAEAHESTSSPTYPNLAHRVAMYYMEMRQFGRACRYLERLISSPAAGEDAILYALPVLIQFYATEAQMRAAAARSERGSSSISHAVVVGSGGAGGGGAAAAAVRRRYATPPPNQAGEASSGDVAAATAMLGLAEAHLERLRALLHTRRSGSSPTSTPASAGVGEADGNGGFGLDDASSDATQHDLFVQSVLEQLDGTRRLLSS